jgi:hypothetical protein
MPKYEIRAMYEYWAEDIEADSPEEAEKIFLEELNSHYYGTYSLDIEEQEEEEEDE